MPIKETERDYHRPVMPDEVMDYLGVVPGGIYVDCTAGGGGHLSRILEASGGQGRVVAIDRDGDAIARLEKLCGTHRNLEVVKDNFRELPKILKVLGIDRINGCLMDLGVSSHQLDTPERGFSFMKDGPLDMRMDRESGLSAKDLVNCSSEERLASILRVNGEERYARRIAGGIVRARALKPLATTADLVEVVKASVPRKAWPKDTHVATRTFQALRIEVNFELECLEEAIRSAAECLETGGRLVVITFHSLEDRIVKRTFRDMTGRCICPPGFPVCRCFRPKTVKVLTTKSVQAGEMEMGDNPRSRSARLRACERI